MATTQEAFKATTTSLRNRLINIGILFLGAATLALHVILYRYNMLLFNVCMSLYITGFAVFIVVVLSKNQSCFVTSPRTYSAISYLSLYTIALEVTMILIMLVVYMMNTMQSSRIASPRY